MLKVTIQDGERFYAAYVSTEWARKHDNGALISCGLTVGEDISSKSLESLRRAGKLSEITKEAWNHSGCQSSCVLRGAAECRW